MSRVTTLQSEHKPHFPTSSVAAMFQGSHNAAVMLLVLLLIFMCHAIKILCVVDTTSLVDLDLTRDEYGSNDNLCFYVRDSKWSASSRTCSWRIRVPRLKGFAHLVLERLPVEVERSGRLGGNEKNQMGLKLNQMLEVKLGNDSESGTRIPWDDERHFQVYPLRHYTDHLDINLVLDSPDRINVSNLFYLRVSYANRRLCSRGLVMQNGVCTAVRVSDRLVQAVAFKSIKGVEDFLQSYEAAAANGEMGTERHRTAEPLRLAMAHCDTSDGEQQLAFWERRSDGTFDCRRWPVSADRLQPGTGQCLAVLRSAATDGAVFRPVSCSDPMPTLLGFPAAPGMGGLCGVEGLHNFCCSGATGDPSDSFSWVVPTVCVIVVLISIAVLAFFAIRRRWCRCPWYRWCGDNDENRLDPPEDPSSQSMTMESQESG